MLAPTGNMAQVYVQSEQDRRRNLMRSIKRKATKAINKAAHSAPPMEAEITEGATADWYLVYTFPGEDLRAMRWLARRRFGVFRPMQQREDKRSGTVVQGWEPIFPGWLFVFCWDIRKLKTRLRNCPGVFEILCDPVTQQPAPVDTVDENGVHFIDRLRARAYEYREQAPRLVRHNVRIPTTKRTIKAGPRRPHKFERKALDRLKNELKCRGFTLDHAMWALANGLEPHLRIALFQRTLSTAPPPTVA